MITPRDKVRDSIIERNRYNPVSPEKAHRASVVSNATVKRTVKAAGDAVITTTGVSKDEQPS